MTSKPLTYFVISAGNVLIAAKQPTTTWESIILCVSCLVAGCVAIRALQSAPPDPAPEKPSPKLPLVIILGASLFFLTGCVTKIHSRSGQTLASTGANADLWDFHYRGGGESIDSHMVKMDHATPTLATGKVVNKGLRTVTSAVAGALAPGSDGAAAAPQVIDTLVNRDTNRADQAPKP